MSTESTRPADHRLVFGAAACWVGALAGFESPSTALAAVAAVAGLAVAASRRLGIAGVVAGLLCLFSGLLVAHHADQKFKTDPLVLMSQEGSGHVRVAITLLDTPVAKQTPWGKTLYVADGRARAAFVDQLWVVSAAKLRLEGPDLQIGSLHRGDTVIAAGKLSAESWLKAPYAGELQISRTHTISGPSSWTRFTNGVRGRMLYLTEQLPQPAAGLILGMSVGDRQLLAPDLKDDMRTSSLTHLTAISGTHIGFVLVILSLVLPGMGPWRTFSMVSFLAVLVGVVGPSPSVLRASAAAILVALSLRIKRAPQAQVTLSSIVLVMLMVDPWMSRSFGFSLSVLATAGLLFTGRHWAKQWGEAALSGGVGNLPWAQWLLKTAAQAAAVSTAATLWVLPILLLLNPWVPLWAVPANVMAAPAVAPVTVLGMLSAALSGINPQLSLGLLHASSPFARWIAWVAKFWASLPGAQLPWPGMPAGPPLAALLVGLVVFYTAYSRRRRRE